MLKIDKDGSGQIDFEEFLAVIKEEQDNDEEDQDSEDEGSPQKKKTGGLGMLFGEQGVLKDLIAKKETFSALDLKKIANMNPNKNAGATKIINKRDNVRKIALMFKGVIKSSKNMLDSGSEDESSEADINEEMQNFMKLKAQMQESLMPKDAVSEFLA